jgi:hypothetical protein
MFINCLWFIEQAWETVFNPFTITKLFGFLRIIFERQGPEKRNVSLFAEFIMECAKLSSRQRVATLKNLKYILI